MKLHVFLSNNGQGNLVVGFPLFTRTEHEIDNVSGYKISLNTEPDQEVGWLVEYEDGQRLQFFNRDFVRSLEYLGEL